MLMRPPKTPMKKLKTSFMNSSVFRYSKVRHEAGFGVFNSEVSKELIYKGTIGIHGLHKTANDNGLSRITFATSRSLVISCFLHR